MSHVCQNHYAGNCWCRPRTRHEIAFDVAVAHDLPLRRAAALARWLRPRKSAVPANVISLARHRDLLKANKTPIGGWTPGSVA